MTAWELATDINTFDNVVQDSGSTITDLNMLHYTWKMTKLSEL
jgi:hypothetical protein